MMWVLLILIVLFLVMKLFKPKDTVGQRGGPTGIQGHMDFLEFHGFVTAEEREEQRWFEKDYKENPQNYKTMTLKEFLKEGNKK